MIRTLTFIFLAASLCMSCKKDNAEPPYTCTTCANTPAAVAANDNNSKGVYKGVLIGSSGTININIANSGSTITATMVIDGTTVAFTSTATPVAGQPFSGSFTGTLNGQPASFTLTVNADGSSPSITASNIPGHTSAVFVIYKELSTELVRIFEGTYNTTKPENGTFNAVVRGNTWMAISRKSDGTSNGSAGGSFVNNQLINANPVVTMGTINGDVLTGSFIDSGNRTVTVNGRRTL